MRKVILLLVISLSCEMILHGQCLEDCVWPGDFNANGIANNLDVLTLGFALEEIGPARIDATTDWEGQTAEDWGQNATFLGNDIKHADANGDGIINDADLISINLNYFKTNDLFAGQLGNNLTGDQLFVSKVDSIASPSGSLIFDIHLGHEMTPVDSIYGIGFQLKIDTQYIENVLVDYSDSWIGQDEEIISYSKYAGETDHAGLAITRVDGNAVSGFGKIARVEIVITDVILGLVADSTVCLPFQIEFKQVLGIDPSANDLMITAQSDSMQIKHPSQLVNTDEITPEFKEAFQLSPNPSKGFFQINSNSELIDEVTLFNGLGQTILKEAYSFPRNQINVEMSDRPVPGVYFIRVRSRGEYYSTPIIFR